MDPIQAIDAMLHGPGRFRYLVQPIVAVVLGIRDGRLDAAAGRPPYILALATGTGRRGETLKSALSSIGVPLVVGFVIDLLMQRCILHRVHVLVAVLSGTLVIALPYAAARALTNRAVRARTERRRPA
ncbi:MAG TPA: hypothetical protein VFQ38_03085 [Longimicrobiales bacterium]|nr:hypothetical protein [Longimicrobiales bacterium]